MNGERIAFENWLGIKPCGAAHDLAWAAWKARASLPAPQQATPEPVNVWTRALEIRMAQGWRLTGDRLPVLYTDSINGDQVMRDDLWLCTTEALRNEPPAAAPEPLIVKGAMAGMVDAQVRDLWPTKGAALAAAQAKGGEQ